MTKLFEASIRVQLFLMAVIVALPAAGIILYSGFEARNEAMAHARTETQVLVDSIAQEQQALVASARQLLSGLAQRPEVRNQDREKVQARLTNILSNNPQYLNIFVLDRQGVMWASAIPSSATIVAADRRYFINAMATGQFSSGECMVGRLVRKQTITFAYPFSNGKGEWDGVIAASLDLGYCDKLLARAKLPAGSNFLLLDHKGVVLSRGVNPGPFVGKPVGPEMMRQMEEGPDAKSFVTQGFLDGVSRVATYRKLYLEGESVPYMYVRSGIPLEVVLSKGNKALFLNLGLLSSVTLFGFAVAWVIGKRSILQRVSTLQAASQRLAAGDFRTRVAEVVKGGELGALGQSFDAMASELHQQQEALRSKALVLDNMAEGVSECDGDGRVVFTNPAFDGMFGYGKGELLGKEMNILLGDPSGLDSPVWAHIICHLQENRVWCGELKNRKKDGTSFFTYARISEIPGTGRFISVQEDIAERKKLEALKEEMISAVSHDMRTPLTALLGYQEFLLENEVDEAALKESLATMYKETRRLDEMIGNFLDLQRIKAQQMTCNFESVGVEGLLRETADLFSNASRNHRIIVTTLLDLPPICGDEARLHQVLNNLVSNAIKYSPGRSDIVLGARREGRFITLWVNDQGIGIPPEAQEKVFDRFYRADSSAHGRFPGSGLGLALVKEIVESHGGVVRVESTPGVGSTFYVSLPIAQTAPVSES